MIHQNVGPYTRKFLYGDRVRFSTVKEYRIHDGHVGQVFKTKIYRGPGTRHQIRYGTECECGATLWPMAPDMELIDRPLDDPDINGVTWDARARYLLRSVGIPESNRMSLESQINTLTGRLSARESEVVLARHGLADDTQFTLQSIADRIGVTRERVRQIEYRAIEKIRKGK